MRPLLNPALRALWRDETTLQLGADTDRATVLSGLDGPAAELLTLLDGTRTSEQLVDAAPALGVSPGDAGHLIELLDQGGLLLDAARPGPLATLAEPERRRLEPDAASWSLRPAGADRVLRARRAATIVVEGAGRVGAGVAGLLAAAAVGHLVVVDDRIAGPGDAGPGGHGTPDPGAARADSAARAAERAAPSTRLEAADRAPTRPPDLVVLSPDGPAAPAGRAEQLLAADVPHLLATTYEQVAVVGPLVLPGRSPCGTCLDLHRADRDRQWPTVAAQLPGPPAPVTGVRAPAACDVVLAGYATLLATAAVLAFLDDPDRQHELAGARLEVRPPSLLPRRRSWGVHPGCGCSWPGSATAG